MRYRRAAHGDAMLSNWACPSPTLPVSPALVPFTTAAHVHGRLVEQGGHNVPDRDCAGAYSTLWRRKHPKHARDCGKPNKQYVAASVRCVYRQELHVHIWSHALLAIGRPEQIAPQLSRRLAGYAI